jgi:peptidoglycan/LPS O-acetylase OafA/YrhL
MRYSPQLDGLRALAAVLVVLFHAKVPGFDVGFMGVDIFFVLSGYLITRLLRDEITTTGRLDYAGFCLRRIRRLYPAFLMMLAVYLAVAPIAFSETPMSRHLQDAIISGLYMADYSVMLDLKPAVIAHTWSLGVEEKFYLIWPPVLLVLMRLPMRTAIAAIWLLFGLATCWRLWNVVHLNHHWLMYHRFDTHVTGLLLGAALGLGRVTLPQWCGYLGLIAMVACMYFLEWRGRTTAAFGFTAIELTAALLVCSRPAVLGHSVLAWLGKMSYGLYLWHYPLIIYGRQHEMTWASKALLGGLGGLALAVISYYTIETYFRTARQPVTARTASD